MMQKAYEKILRPSSSSLLQMRSSVTRSGVRSPSMVVSASDSKGLSPLTSSNGAGLVLVLYIRLAAAAMSLFTAFWLLDIAAAAFAAAAAFLLFV